MKKPSSANRGAALLIALAFIVLITIVIVGFTASMGSDRPAANLYLERTRASLLAQAGVDSAVATLRQDTADTNRNWISSPGQLVAGSATDDPTTTVDERKVLSVVAPLNSGTASTATMSDPVLSPCNLNVKTFRDSTANLITGADPTLPTQMNIAWIYVRQDGTRDTSQTPSTASTLAPIVGRYAYWADDESSKINYNLAWGRTTTPPNTNAPGSPTKTSLMALTGMSAAGADAIHNYITLTSAGVNFQTMNHGFFDTPEQARAVDPADGVPGVLSTNRFEVTHYSDDPDTTFFGQPRILLTTQGTLAGATWNAATSTWVGGKPFLNIGIGPSANYSGTISLADLEQPTGSQSTRIAAYKATVRMLVSYLQRTDWPMVSGSGSSFQQKYYSSYASNQQFRLTQLAINIIDYVRSKESSGQVVVPSRGLILPADVATGDFTLSWDTNPDANGLGNPANAPYIFVGQTRAPRINEMGVWVQQVGFGSTPTYLYKIKVELYLPANYGISQIDLIGGNYGMSIDEFSEVAMLPPTFNPAGNVLYEFRFADPTITPAQLSLSNSGLLKAGNYVTVGYYPTLTPNSTSVAVKGRVDGLRVALFQYYPSPTFGSHSKLDFAPLLANYTNVIYYTQDAATTTEAKNSSVEVDDPRINTFGGNAGVAGDWIQNTQNTYDAVNSRYSVGNAASTVVPQPSTGAPQLDTDTNGNISDASLYMPPPAGQTFTRADGSVDDNTLGVVTSVGELGYIDTGMESTAKRGLPWRTLRMQTSALDNTVVPDWALMDLFTVPSTVSTNAASIATPYTNSYGGRVNLNSQVQPFSMARTIPLTGVLLGASDTGSTTLSSAQAQTLASNIYNHVFSPLNANTAAYGKSYGYPQAYVSPGEMIEVQGIGDRGEAGEALVRDVANLVTTRGNTFSVYTVGQALRQTPSGTLQVTAEERLQGMVERYLSNSTIGFRTVYFRNLTP